MSRINIVRRAVSVRIDSDIKGKFREFLALNRAHPGFDDHIVLVQFAIDIGDAISVEFALMNGSSTEPPHIVATLFLGDQIIERIDDGSISESIEGVVVFRPTSSGMPREIEITIE